MPRWWQNLLVPFCEWEMYNRISILPELAEYQAAHAFLGVPAPPSKHSNQRRISLLFIGPPLSHFSYFTSGLRWEWIPPRRKYQSWKTNLPLRHGNFIPLELCTDSLHACNPIDILLLHFSAVPDLISNLQLVARYTKTRLTLSVERNINFEAD